MTEKKQVNFRVREDTKERWKDAVDNGTEYQSLTHLITHSVSQELKGEDESASTTTGASEVTAEAIQADVVPALEQIERAVGSLDERLTHVESDLKAEGVEYDVEQAVLDVLPSLSHPPEGHKHLDRVMTTQDVHDTLESRGIMVDRARVRQTLEGLADTTGFVVQIEGDDERPRTRDTMFYKKE